MGERCRPRRPINRVVNSGNRYSLRRAPVGGSELQRAGSGGYPFTAILLDDDRNIVGGLGRQHQRIGACSTSLANRKCGLAEPDAAPDLRHELRMIDKRIAVSLVALNQVIAPSFGLAHRISFGPKQQSRELRESACCRRGRLADLKVGCQWLCPVVAGGHVERDARQISLE